MSARKEAKKLRAQKNQNEKELKKCSQELQGVEASLHNANMELDKVKGPFQIRLDNKLQKMNLKRQVYHKGALVGNDVDKLFQSENIKFIVRVFRPIKVQLQNGNCAMFGDVQLMGKISTLLLKLSGCYKLYSRSSPLCKHEVNFLSIRCSSLGAWFPVNFPTTNLLRKFHVLTHHVPEKAIRQQSTGMEAEHCSESIHPIVNKLDRTYATIQNSCQRLTYMASK